MFKMVEMALVRHFWRHNIGDKGLKDLTMGSWKHILSCKLVSYVYSNGWLSFYFQSTFDASNILVGS